MSKNISPNYNYLDQKLSIASGESLKEAVLATCETLEMDMMAKDVEPFYLILQILKKLSALKI